MTTMSADWPFEDQRNVAVFASKKIVDGGDCIYYVSHDEEDGAWQFHPHSGITPEAEATVVSLGLIVERDSSIRSLADLPCGWHAWRETPDSKWERSPKH